MKKFFILMIFISFIPISEADNLKISFYDSFDDKEKPELIRFKINLKLKKLNVISTKDVNFQNKSISKDNISFKNSYEQHRFEKEIKSIPKNHQFLIHLNEENKVYKITTLGDIFALDVSHTRLHENKIGHSHIENAVFNINSADVEPNYSMILASKLTNSYSLIDTVIF